MLERDGTLGGEPHPQLIFLSVQSYLGMYRDGMSTCKEFAGSVFSALLSQNAEMPIFGKSLEIKERGGHLGVNLSSSTN